MAKQSAKAVLQLDKLTGEVIAEYESVCEAEKQTDISADNIRLCCKGKRKSAGRYCWRFREEEV